MPVHHLVSSPRRSVPISVRVSAGPSPEPSSHPSFTSAASGVMSPPATTPAAASDCPVERHVDEQEANSSGADNTEWGPECPGSVTRSEDLRAALSTVERLASRDAVLLGDFNFG